MDTYGKGGTSNLEKVYDKNTNTTQPNTSPQPNKPQPTQQKQGRFPNPNTLTQSQLKSSIDVVVHNLLKEFVELKEASQVVNNTSLKAVDSAGLSSNQAKLFKTNFTKLSNIIKIISKYKSNNQPLKTKTKVMVDFMDNVIAKAKTNPISNMDLNTLLNSDEKSLKIFISDYYKTIYSTKIIRRGNKDIMTGLSSININKLSEASERIPSKSVMNKVYNDRRLFIKNLPIYINYMFEILLVLKDLNLKGENQNKTTNTQNQGGNTTQTNNQSVQGQGNNQSSQGQETTQSSNETSPEQGQDVSGSKTNDVKAKKPYNPNEYSFRRTQF
jgi:hypothetical protein